MDPGTLRAVRVTRLVPGLFGCALLLLCCRAELSSTLTVTGIVGESSLLPCLDTNMGKEVNNEIRVYWQVANQCIYAYYSGQEHPDQNYSNRAKLFTTEFKQGNFSLLLTDIQVSDEAKYICLIQLKTSSLGYSVVLKVTVTLQVAAHYAEPTLTSEGQQGEGMSVRLTCSSWGGYPEPIVHWTSGFLNIDENSTAENFTNCSREQLCNVTSVLWAHTALNSITCKIYNAKLKENKTATYIGNFFQEYNISNIVSETHRRWTITVVIVVVILVLLVAYILLGHFSKPSSADGVAAQQSELASFVGLDPAV